MMGPAHEILVLPLNVASMRIDHHGVLINVQVKEHLPHQWTPLQVTG